MSDLLVLTGHEEKICACWYERTLPFTPSHVSACIRIMTQHVWCYKERKRELKKHTHTHTQWSTFPLQHQDQTIWYFCLLWWALCEIRQSYRLHFFAAYCQETKFDPDQSSSTSLGFIREGDQETVTHAYRKNTKKHVVGVVQLCEETRFWHARLFFGMSWAVPDTSSLFD